MGSESGEEGSESGIDESPPKKRAPPKKDKAPARKAPPPRPPPPQRPPPQRPPPPLPRSPPPPPMNRRPPPWEDRRLGAECRAILRDLARDGRLRENDVDEGALAKLSALQPEAAARVARHLAAQPRAKVRNVSAWIARGCAAEARPGPPPKTTTNRARRRRLYHHARRACLHRTVPTTPTLTRKSSRSSDGSVADWRGGMWTPTR